MRVLKLSFSKADFIKIVDADKTLEIRASGYNDPPELFRHNRPRPSAGHHLVLFCPKLKGYMPLRAIRAVRTVAIYMEDSQPLWINGEPVTQLEQNVFAKKAGYPNWASFAFAVATKYGTEFDGYSIEW